MTIEQAQRQIEYYESNNCLPIVAGGRKKIEYMLLKRWLENNLTTPNEVKEERE